jgi:hypothetical protein
MENSTINLVKIAEELELDKMKFTTIRSVFGISSYFASLMLILVKVNIKLVRRKLSKY